MHSLKKHLVEQGYKVVCASDGYGAMHAFMESKPQLIILEYIFPGGTGGDVKDMVRAHEDGEDVPVIFLSALPQAELLTKVPADSNIRHLSKPVDFTDLKAVLDELLGAQAAAPEPDAYPPGHLPPSQARPAFDSEERDPSGDDTVLDLDADEPPAPPR